MKYSTKIEIDKRPVLYLPSAERQISVPRVVGCSCQWQRGSMASRVRSGLLGSNIEMFSRQNLRVMQEMPHSYMMGLYTQRSFHLW